MRKRPLLTVCVLLVAVVWLRLASGGYDSPTEVPEEGMEALVTGQVCKKEEQKIWLKSVVIQCKSNQDQENNPRFQKISYDGYLICEQSEEWSGEELSLGNHVVLSGIVTPFSEETNPGGFDAKAYYRSLGAGARLRRTQLLARDETVWRVREAMVRLRGVLHRRLYSVFPEREASVMGALLLGEKSDTDEALKELYKRSGILHILSISSLHITILGMSLYKALRRLGLPIAPCAVAGAVVLVLYGFLTGFSVSACRAIGMYLIRMAGAVCGRTYDLLTALGILAAGMVLYRPFFLENTGFLLSFLAVLGIGALYPALRGKRGSVKAKYYGEPRVFVLLRRLRQELKDSLLSSLSATLATLPVQLWFFYEAPVCAVFVNLFVLPFVKPLLIAGIFCLIPGLGAAGLLDRGILWWYETVCRGFELLGADSGNPGRPQIWQVVVYYAVICCAVWVGRKRGTARESAESRRSGCRAQLWKRLPLFLAVAAVAVFLLPAEKKNRVIFPDVGQGDCCLVQTRAGENYLFDCGSSSRSQPGEDVLLPVLKYYGIRRLDGVFVSHPDTDHGNGISELLALAGENNITIERLCLPAVEEDRRQEQFGELLKAAGEEIPVVWIAAGEGWESGGVSFVCLHPEAGYPADNENAYSACFYVDFKSFSLLLTGDVEGEGEKALLAELQRRRISGITLLKVAHHGSRNSTSDGLLEQLSPVAAVISCGRNNRYGHPHEELLERLNAQECQVFCTAEDGAVIVWEERGGVRVKKMTE